MNRTVTYRIVIIEPSVIIQQGIKSLLAEYAEFKVVRCFSDYEAFKQATETIAPELILINPALVNFHKQFAIKSIFPDYPDTLFVAILYSYVDAETIESFDGFIDIYDDARHLGKKLKKILSTQQAEHADLNDNADLSDREKEILISVAKGLTNKEIANTHNISVHTVISHRKNIARKTGIKTISGLTMYAVVNNLISRDDFV